MKINLYLFKSILLFLSLLILTDSNLLGQQSAVFDGENDFAQVETNASLSIREGQDFTLEFFIEGELNNKKPMALLAKHNKDKGIVCAIDENRTPYFRINNKIYAPAKASMEAGCNHVVYQRKDGKLQIVINNKVSEAGSNSTGIINESDLIIGNSPNTDENYYGGSIDEIRWWNTFRSETLLKEFSGNCLKGEQEGLIAYWNIEEKNGQFVNDLYGGLHGRMGTSYEIDSSDPSFEKSKCEIEKCCDLPSEINFTNEGNNYVFTNPSESGNFNWTINGEQAGSKRELEYEFTNTGDYLVSLTITTKEGCKMVYSIVVKIEIFEEIEFCDGFEKTYNDPNSVNEKEVFFDRFGNSYTANELKIPGQANNNTHGLQLKSAAAPACDCQTDFGINTNHFELYFEDCEIGTGTGFDDPSVSGSSTLGRERRRTVCQVYADLSQTILQNNATCGNANDKVRVLIMPSQANGYYPDGSNLAPLPAAVGGAASAFTTYGPKEGIVEVMPWIVLNTGADQQFSYNAPFYHGFLRINFSSFIEDWQVDHTIPVGSSKVDLYSVALHESMHMLGMASNLIYDGTNWISRLTGTSTGGYSRWDSFMKRASGNLDVITNSSGFNWVLNTGLSLPGDLLNSCNGIDLYIGNNQAPLYSGTIGNYSAGSSLSHLDENCIPGSNFVLNPSISTGDDKRTLSTTELQLFTDLGYKVAGVSNCVVTGVDDFYGNCSKTFVVSSCPGSSLNISTADLIANDINATGATSVSLLANTGNLQMVTSGSFNSDYILTPNINSSGDLIIRYQPVGCSGQIGNTTYAVVQVIPCVDCSFPDVAVAQTTNSYIIDNGPNCGSSPTAGKCVDCGFNKNPDNLICNPEFCADDTNLILDYSHFDCNGAAVVGLPGWYRAIATPGYVAPSVDNSVGASRREFATPLHPNSGYMHNAIYGFNESMYTDVSITPGRRYFYSNYANSSTTSFGANAEMQVLMLSANYNVNTQFACSSSYNTYPTIYPSDYINVMNWDMQQHFIPGNSNNSHPFDRNGSFVNVPANFPGAYLLITNRRLQGSNGQVDIFVDQVELVEDDFSAGDDQNLTCGLSVDLGGEDFGMLSDVNVQYTWTNQVTGITEADYRVERELDGTLIIYDLVNLVTLSQIPTITVSPGVTTNYRLTRTFLLDGDGTFGGLPNTVFNGVSLTDEVIVNVPTSPVANTSFTHTINCNVTDFLSHPSTIGSPFSHSWDIDGDGNWDYFTENPSHAYAFNGIYNVIHEVSNGCGTFVSNQSVTITDNELTLSLVSSNPGPLVQGNTFTVDVTVTNIGTATIDDIILALPAPLPSAGLSYSYGPTNIGSLAGGQPIVITVPVSVTGICGSEQVCAEIISADNACSIPSVCTSPLDIVTNPPLDQAIQVSNVLTTTYPAPYVVGGLVEFEVTATNQTSTALSNIDLDYLPNGISLIGSSPANFPLPAYGSNTFTVLAKVLDCNQFSLESIIESVDDTCPGNTPTSLVSGNVTPYTITVSAVDQVCSNSTNLQAQVIITNPSNQTITDVRVLPTSSSNSFQNLQGNLNNLTLAPSATTTASFTFESTGNVGNAFICASIESIGTGTDLINYSCVNKQSCTPVAVFDNPVTVTLTASPTDGTHRCIYQNARINYVLEITNNLSVPINSMNVNTVLSGLTLITGASIPTTLSLPANGSETYIFGGDAQIPAGSADITVDVISNITGCSVASASTSHPIFYTVNDVLSSTTAISTTTPGPYVYGQTIAFDVTVNNFSPYQINGIELNGVDPSFANSLNNISNVPLFDLPAGTSVVKTITAQLTNCSIWEFYGQITQTASTCFGNLISTRLSGVVGGGFSIIMSPINTICDNSTGSIDFQVINPTSQTLNNVLLSANGAAFGSLFSSLGSITVSLDSDNNNNFFSIPFTANSGVAGQESICVSLDRVESLNYSCSNVQACGTATVIKDMEVFAYTIPINPTSFCSGQYVNFVSGFKNNSNVPVLVDFDNTLVGATVLNNAPLNGTAVTVNAGAVYSVTYLTTINSGVSIASLTSDYTTINATTCNGATNYVETVSVPVLAPLNQALTMSSVITNTFPGAHVVGGEVEFEVTVENRTTGPINNIDLNFSTTGLTNVTASPPNFSLTGGVGVSTSFLVTGTVTDCTSFDLVSQIASASGVCSSGAINETITGNVTPFGITISSPALACAGASGMQATITINNPSGQTINDVNLSVLTGSTLFQNVSLINPVTLVPSNNTVVNFTFDSNGSTGSENACVMLNSIGQGINAIPYSCTVNQACDITNIIANPLLVSLTANPADGTAICVDQNPVINYTLTIENPTSVDLTGLTVTSVLNGVTINSGQIPTSVSILAGITQPFQFSGTAIAGFNNASVQIDIANGLAGCLNSSATISHPLYRDLNNVLQVSVVPLTTAPYVMGEVITYRVTVDNNSSNPVNNINMDYQHTGLINTTLSPGVFNLAASGSTTFIVNSTIDDCQFASFSAELLSADQTCANLNPIATINTPVTPFTIQLSGPDLTCSGTSTVYTVDVFHPGSVAVSNVELTITGGSAFNGLPVTQLVNLQPGNNSIPLNVGSIAGSNGVHNLCVTITKIGSSFYNCVVAACKAIELTDNPISISIRRTNRNLLCSNGTASFDVTITNLTNTDLTGIYFAITGSTHYSPTNIPANVSLLAGSSQVFTIDGNILANVADLNFCLEVTQIANLSCLPVGTIQGCVTNIDVNNLSLPLEVEDALSTGNPALSLEVIYDLALDADGNMYGVGGMRSQAIINANGVTNVTSTASCLSSLHPFVFKYSNGGIEWVNTPDGCGVLTSIDVNRFGEVFVGMNVFGTLNFAGSSNSSAGATDIAVLKYSDSGAEEAVLFEGGSGSEYVVDLKVQGSKIFITGGTMALHPTLQGAGYTGQYLLGGNTYTYHDYYYPHNNAIAFGDAFTASYSNSGTSFSNNWISVIESPIIPNKIELDAAGNSYVVGVALQNFIFGHIPLGGQGTLLAQTTYANGVPDVIGGSNFDIDAFVISYTPSGSNRWGGLYGSTSMDYPETLVTHQNTNSGSIYHQTDIAISASGQLYVAFQSLVTYFGQPSGSATYSFQQQMGSHIVNLNPNTGRIGINEWSVPAGSPVTQSINGASITGNAVMHPVIAVDNDDNVFLSGVFNLSTQLFQTADFYSTNGGPAPLLLATPADDKGLVTEKFDVNGNFVWADANSTYVPYNGAYHPTFTPGNNPLRPLDLEVNACGIYQAVLLDGSMEVAGITYNGTPYDAFVFRIVDDPSGFYYGRSADDIVPKLSSEVEEEQIALQIYPNPNNGRFSLALTNVKEKGIKNIVVFNASGRAIKTLEYKGESIINFNFSDQQSGMYFVRINGNDFSETKKVILTK